MSHIIRRFSHEKRVVHLAQEAAAADALLTEAGEELITEAGDVIIHEDTET